MTPFLFIRCLTYIDLNMVRAGRVKHPSEWKQSGFNEIQQPPKRFQIINRVRFCELTGVIDVNKLSAEHAQWINQALASKNHQREEKWTTSLAIGSHSFAEGYLDKAGGKASYRKMKVLEGCTGY